MLFDLLDLLLAAGQADDWRSEQLGILADFLRAVKALVGADPLALYEMKNGRIAGRAPSYAALLTKSGLMVGLGESFDEMVDALGTLREHYVQVLTIGQYLRPTKEHLPIVRYWHPDEFEELERVAYELGFEHVAAGPDSAPHSMRSSVTSRAHRRRYGLLLRCFPCRGSGA